MQDFKGKARWRRDEDGVDGILALDVPLELLGKPICRRSSAHLEAALHFIEVTLRPALVPCLPPHRCQCPAWWAAQWCVITGWTDCWRRLPACLHHSRVSFGL